MQIQFKLPQHDEPQDLIDVYGEIRLTGHDDKVITDEFTTIDYFIEAVVDALIEVSTSNHSSIDWSVEPNPIEVLREGESITISYGEESIKSQYSAAIGEVNRAYSELIAQLPSVNVCAPPH